MLLCITNEALRCEDVYGSEGVDPYFLTSAVDGGELLGTRHGRFNPRDRDP
jgi:hypothetical protein